MTFYVNFKKAIAQNDNTKGNKDKCAQQYYHGMLQIQFNKYYDSSDPKRSKTNSQYTPANLKPGEYDYSEWYNGLYNFLPLEVDEGIYYWASFTFLDAL